jgi:NAD(P)-dependent dehydrogenase (short-subunit alcohol dehydrogenase family)
MDVLSKFLLKNRVAIVTGGCGHLGKSMTEALIEAGATVVVWGRSEEKFKNVFGNPSSKLSFALVDISKTKSIKDGFKSIQKKYGRLDVLVNNAVYSAANVPDQMTDDEWGKGIDGVLNSVFRCTREGIPYMKKIGGGAIINIASMYGVISPDFRIYKKYPRYLNPPNYGSAKAGVIQLTKYCSVYYAANNIRVNCISPGAFPSEMIQKEKGFIKELSGHNPMGRVGKPDELKGAVVFLASQASSYMTGQNLIIDGGWTAW